MKYLRLCSLLFCIVFMAFIPSDALDPAYAVWPIYQVSSFRGFSLRGGGEQEFFEQPGFRQFGQRNIESIDYPSEKYISLYGTTYHAKFAHSSSMPDLEASFMHFNCKETLTYTYENNEFYVHPETGAFLGFQFENPKTPLPMGDPLTEEELLQKADSIINANCTNAKDFRRTVLQPQGEDYLMVYTRYINGVKTEEEVEFFMRQDGIIWQYQHTYRDAFNNLHDQVTLKRTVKTLNHIKATLEKDQTIVADSLVLAFGKKGILYLRVMIETPYYPFGKTQPPSTDTTFLFTEY